MRDEPPNLAVVAPPDADAAILRLDSPWSGVSGELPIVPIGRDEIPRHDGMIYSYHDPQGLQACKGDADDESQGFLATAAPIENRTYELDDHPRTRVSTNLSPGYSGSPWVLVPCGRAPFCVIGMYVEDYSADVGGGAVELIDDSKIRDLLANRVSLSSYQPAARSPPPTATLALTGMAEHYFGPVLEGWVMGGRITGYVPVTGIGRRHRPAIGLTGSFAYASGGGGRIMEQVVSPVPNGVALVNQQNDVAHMTSQDIGAYIETQQALGGFWRGELTALRASHAYTDERDQSSSLVGYGGRVRVAVSLPLGKVVMIDVGVSGRGMHIGRRQFGLRAAPGVVDVHESGSFAVAFGLDLGLRFLPGDAL